MSDFFDHQRDAILRARWALAGFCITLLLVMGTTAVLVAFLLTEIGYWKDIPVLINARNTAPLSAALTFLILSIFCILRALKLRKGLAYQLRTLGGNRILADSPIPAYRQLHNLVEEMAIASGLPVPDLYVLDEEGVNACAFGFNPQTTAIGITRGAVSRLPCEQLQAILAHEFSHILYGDFLLNTRLLVGLAGLFGVARIGYLLIFSSLGPQRGSHRFGGIGFRTLPLFLMGWGFILTGSIGTFFGKLLQAAVSRQREYLADASAVQFTRNPSAVSDALKTLGTASFRGHCRNPAFIECAHMMFANAQVLWVTGLFSTHPPLAKRIRHCDPNWDGTFPTLGRRSLLNESEPDPPETSKTFSAASPWIATHLWLEETPNPLQNLLRTPEGASAFVLQHLLSSDPQLRAQQNDILHHQDLKGVGTALETLQTQFPATKPNDRFPLLDLCSPGLRNLPAVQKNAILDLAHTLARADQRIDLCEYAILCHLDRILAPPALGSSLRKQTRTLSQLRKESVTLLSILARLDAQTEAEVGSTFQTALKQLPARFQDAPLLPADACTLKAMDTACKTLRRLQPRSKRHLLRACRGALEHNGILQENEEAAYRAVASLFDVPVPPDFRRR